MKTIAMGLINIMLGLCLCACTRYTQVKIELECQVPYGLAQSAQKLTVSGNGRRAAQETLRKIHGVSGVDGAFWAAEIEEQSALYLWGGAGYYEGTPLAEGTYLQAPAQGSMPAFMAKEGTFLQRYASKRGGISDLNGRNETLVGVYGADHPLAGPYKESIYHYDWATELNGVYYIDAQADTIAALADVFRADGYHVQLAAVQVPMASIPMMMLGDGLYRTSLFGAVFALVCCFLVQQFLCLGYVGVFEVHWRFGGRWGMQLRRLSGRILAATAVGAVVAGALYSAHFAQARLALSLPVAIAVVFAHTLIVYALFVSAFFQRFRRYEAKGAMA